MIITSIDALRRRLLLSRMRGRTIGLVPTMGALHEGHLKLIAKARADCQVVVASIFVNPIQFNRREDFAHYPRTLESDTRQCSEAGVDVIFAPAAEEMYPAPLATFVDVPALGEHLCGPHRPGHFRGVATVVMKLLQIVQPDVAYFGEKDAQQLAVIRRMVRDLNVPVEIVAVPTVREADGLALSSRNQRLTPEERQIAPMLYRALQIAAWEGIGKAREFLQAEPRIRLEYLEAVDPVEMQPVGGMERPALIAIAAWIGNVRLIDNLLVPA
ncbi:MAG: pantoate--beta-alanine ligase [Bryobacteraceae bacterium]|jgi:pantoate--beta-alanine ligase